MPLPHPWGEALGSSQLIQCLESGSSLESGSQTSSFGISRHVVLIPCPAAHPKHWNMQCNHQSLNPTDGPSGSSHSLDSSSPTIPKQFGVFQLLFGTSWQKFRGRHEQTNPQSQKWAVNRTSGMSRCFQGPTRRILVFREAHTPWTQRPPFLWRFYGLWASAPAFPRCDQTCHNFC